MPYKKPSVIKREKLPSDSAYWVDWKTTITYGDLKQATAAAFKVTDDGKAEMDTSAYTSYNILAHIAAWNLDDEIGNALPLTVEALDALDEEDANFLTGKLGKSQKEETEQRAKSPTPSKTTR